jgi:hypothetical protein
MRDEILDDGRNDMASSFVREARRAEATASATRSRDLDVLPSSRSNLT